MPLQPPNFGKTWGNENCYWYAVNHTYADEASLDAECPPCGNPGTWSGQTGWGLENPDQLEAAIIADGAVRVGSRNAPQMPAAGSRVGYYLIAAKCGGGNYHFCRRDESTGQWYQKVPLSTPGAFQNHIVGFVPHVDSWNPARVTLQYLHLWVGYFWVPDSGLPAVAWPQYFYESCTIL